MALVESKPRAIVGLHCPPWDVADTALFREQTSDDRTQSAVTKVPGSNILLRSRKPPCAAHPTRLGRS